MLYWLELIIILVLFCLHDSIIEKKRGKSFLFKVLIRFITSIIISIPCFYLTNNSLIINTVNTTNKLMISFSILLIINLIICIFSKQKQTNISKAYYFFIKVFLIVFTLELTVFNYQHYLTIGLKENKIKDIEYVNLKKQNNTYTAIGKGTVGFKIKLSNTDINSLYFPIENADNKLVTYKIKILDKESSSYIDYNETNSYLGISKSHYKIINNTFDTDTLLLEITEDKDGIFSFDSIKVNTVVPIHFSYIRVFLVLVIIFLFYLFHPKSFIYKIKFTTKQGKILINSFLCISIILVTILTNINHVFRNNNAYKYLYPLISINEYHELTESFLNGKFYLKIEPSDSLKELKNPYSPYERNKNNSSYLWDVAYYNGHYYVYFGVVPVVISYLPYYMITGHHLDNNIAILFALIVTMITFVSLIKIIMKKYFKNENAGLLLLLSVFGIFANHFMIPYVARRPDFYTVPVIYGIMFSLLGLNFWLRSKNENKTLNKKYLLLGSLCMALVSGCRPQLLLTSFSALPIFWDSFKDKKIFSKKSIKESLCFLLPYIIIAFLMMGYNYVRFNSILDFGANYNLTTNDMTARGFHFERFLSAIYYYFLAVPRITNIFPFIETIPLNTTYMGITIYERTFGGIFILCPILILSLFFYKFKNNFKEKMLYYLSGLFTISAIIIALADSQMAGILPRYFLDFNWLLVISTIIIILSIIEKNQKTKFNNIIISYLTKITVVLLVLNFFLCFIDVSFSYQDIMPSIFYRFYYLIQFWL